MIDADKGLRSLRLTGAAREQLKADLNMECSMRMSNSLLEEFIGLGHLLRLPRGQAIIRRGEFDDNLYVLTEGIMRICRMDVDKEVTEAFGLPATLVLSHHCYDQGRPSVVSYEACTPCKVLRIARADYDALLERNHEFALWNLSVSHRQLFRYEQRDHELVGTAQERYEAFIRHRPEIMSSVPLRMIASYLGMTPEYLSRLRSKHAGPPA